MNYLCALSCCFALVFFSCKRETKKPVEEPVPVTTGLEPGLPGNGKQLNGYLYACRTSKEDNYFYIRLHAVFNDPGADLCRSYNHALNQIKFDSGFGNIGVGTVKFDTDSIPRFPVFGINTLLYTKQKSSIPEALPNPKWKTSGNGSFKPLDQQVTRGFPLMTDASRSFSLSLGAGYKLDFADFISNYDSVVVLFTNNSNFKVTKRTGPQPFLSFSKAEIMDLSFNLGSYCTMIIQAFNYSSRTIENKVYLFELASELETKMLIKP